MKRMQQKLFMAALGLFLLQAPAFADNERPIQVAQLPAQAQVVLQKDFARLQVSYAEMEKDGREISYEVKFSNGASIEFDKNGNWKEIDFQNAAVPSHFVPQPILNHVKKEWPRESIVKIERDRKGYEVELSSDVEITYNKKFKVIEIDR